MADIDNGAITTSDSPSTSDSGNGGGFSALSGTAPASAPADYTSDTPVSPSDNGPAPAPTSNAPTPAPVKPASKWESILMGALQGMVGGAGQKFFGTGMAAGAANVQNLHQQGIENQQRQQQINQEQQRVDMEKQLQPSKVQFASAQAASMAADASIKAHQAAYFDEDHARGVEADNRATADWFMNHGFNPIAATANDGHSEMAAMNSMGTVPPTTTLQVAGNSLLHFDLSQMPQQVGLDYVNQQNAKLGKGQIDPQTWGQMPQAARIQMVYGATQYWNPTVSEDTLLQYQNDRARVAAIPDSQLPDKAATLAHYDLLIKGMKATLDKANQRSIDQKNAVTLGTAKADASAAGQKAYATSYGDAKGALDAANTAVQDANGNWNPASVPVSLVEGNMDPSQLSKRGKDYNAQLQAANQYSLEKYGKPFDIAQAQLDYSYSKNPQTQNTLRMINGMAEPGGAIQIATQAAQSLPKSDSQLMNKLFNTTATQFGSTQETNFHTAMLGLADEYSKVMGGGVSSDTGRQQALDILKAAYSKGQINGAIGIMKQDIAARKSAIIGGNRYLQRQFGGPVQSSQPQQAQAVPQGAVGKIKGSDGNWYWTSDGKSGNLGRAQ